MTTDDPKPPPELDAAVDAVFAYGRHKRALGRERPKYSHPTLTPTGRKRKRRVKGSRKGA